MHSQQVHPKCLNIPVPRNDDDLISLGEDSLRSIYEGFMSCFLKPSTRKVSLDKPNVLKPHMPEKPTILIVAEMKSREIPPIPGEQSFESIGRSHKLSGAMRNLQRLNSIKNELKMMKVPTIVRPSQAESRAKSVCRNNSWVPLNQNMPGSLTGCRGSIGGTSIATRLMISRLATMNPVHTAVSSPVNKPKNSSKSKHLFSESCKMQETDNDSETSNYHSKLITDKLRTKIQADLLVPLVKRTITPDVHIVSPNRRNWLRAYNYLKSRRRRRKANRERVGENVMVKLERTNEIYQGLKMTINRRLPSISARQFPELISDGKIRDYKGSHNKISSAKTSPMCTPRALSKLGTLIRDNKKA